MSSIDSLQLLSMSHTEQNTDFNRKSNRTLQFPQGVLDLTYEIYLKFISIQYKSFC